ncbi:MAG: hypothetical protein IT561_09565 [Alphaproteobacteria bacterium]|nr:hypothetical protein [Alphaproteobacteria bacterium]
MNGAAPVRILADGRLAAGNRLGGIAGLWARVAWSDATAIDEGALGRWLAEVDPNVASELALTPAPGPADAVAAFARVAAALMASGRSLAIVIDRETTPAGRSALVIVEEGRAVAPERVMAAAADLLAAAVAGLPAAGFRDRVADCGAPPIKAFLRYAYTLIPARLAARGAAARPALGQRGSLVGEGVGARLFLFTMGRGTGALGAAIAARKDACAALLSRFGLPVPRQLPVADADAAEAAAGAIGYPVVVKPADRSGGAGVAAGLAHAAEVRQAFARAAAVSRRIVVEEMLRGEDHRLTVIGGRMVAAALRVPPEVVGDGRRSVRALIDAVNADPQRGGSRSMLLPLVCDGETDRLLAAAGLTFASVPPAGMRVRLHSAANLTMGARPVDVTASVHPDNRAAAVHAAAIMGLDLAGIDFISPDIGRSWREIGGGICEVNREPGLLVHQVAEGGPDMAEACARHILAPAPLVPIVAVLGGGDADAAAQAIAAAMAESGLAVGLAAGRHLVAAGLRLSDPGPGDPLRVTRLVAHPAVEAVVAAVPPAAVVARGFGHGRADVALVAEPGAPDLAAATRIMAAIGAEVVDGSSPLDADLVRRIAARRPPS